MSHLEIDSSSLTGLTMAENLETRGEMYYCSLIIFTGTLWRGRGFCSPWKNAFCCRVSTYASRRNGRLQERITSTKDGSITSIQAVYVPADDLTDPSPATTFAHLDATVVLSRQIAELGIYPAVDPLDNLASIRPLVVGQNITIRHGLCKIPCKGIKN